MTEIMPHGERNQPQDTAEVCKRKTIPASSVGVSLAISDEALIEIDRIQEESIKAAQEVQNLYWR